MIDLAQRRPELSTQELTHHLTPSARYAHVSFDNYQPNPAFPSQAQARDTLRQFVAGLGQPSKPSGWWPFSNSFIKKRSKAEGKGIYLDGGFGVGKTHLLASAYHTSQALPQTIKAALMSFQDLMYIIGALGMAGAVAAFKDHDLLLIDEFELDDPGNAHMANTFLEQLMPAGINVVTTSNTAPNALGEGRFNARDFQRQIQGIAGRFQNIGLDGPDYRQRGETPAEVLSPTELDRWLGRQNPDTLARLSFSELGQVLLAVHPSRFAKLLDGVDAVLITDLETMYDQNIALRFVHFIDKVYDLGLHAAFTGVPLTHLFDEHYRHGAYAKKYSRTLSRLSEMLSEARQTASSQDVH